MMEVARTAASRAQQVVPPEERDQRAVEYVHGLDDNVAACLGDHHDWPQLQIKSGKLPRGISALPTGYRDGSFLIRVSCKNGCGRVRTKMTLPKGVLPEPGTNWRYEGGPKPPKGLGLTRHEYVGENQRRISDWLGTQAGDQE
jgi:hypothetical protein